MRNRELEETIFRKVRFSIGGIATIFFTGTLYYHFVEKLSLLDAMFFTAITISTVGYGVPKELSIHGKLFTMLLIFAGLSFVLYGISSITALLVEGEFNRALRERRKERRIGKMDAHVIVVGIGNIGSQVVNQLLRYGEEVVGIDKELSEENLSERVRVTSTGKFILVNGDATKEDVLIKAGIKRARALITTLPDDSQNVFVTLTAKNLNPNIFVISNITNLNNLTKLIYAGVDQPIATAEIAGLRIVETLRGKKAKESLIDVLNIRNKTFKVETVKIENTVLVGKRIEELRLKEKYGIFIVAVLKGEELLLGPSKDYKIEKTDILVIFGEESGVERFRKDLL
ncbi:potassium channel family protein [Fervidobacterium thailandense]|uniref:Potassium transporter TrkA n=1 Tax=Fervidobacterium thailandense TaxID=1008305 RepID=A0A1E3G544_9BACT|nr:potassium channel protein [Fervidobacterium thailandense]ODN31260.1 potassium transporter TrkA [Fervidobacterium thailandense]